MGNDFLRIIIQYDWGGAMNHDREFHVLESEEGIGFFTVMLVFVLLLFFIGLWMVV